MHEIRAIRERPAEFAKGLSRRGAASSSAIVDDLLAKDRELRALQARLQQAQARRNDASRAIGIAKAQKDEEQASTLMAEVAGLKEQIRIGEVDERNLKSALDDEIAAL